MIWEGTGLKQARHLWLLLALCVLAPGCPSTQSTPPPPAPAAPTNLILTSVSTCQIKLDWTNVPTNATFNVIFRSTDGVAFNQIALLPATSVTYTDLGLQPSFFYWYRVLARNRGGDSSLLEDVTVTQDLFWNPVSSVGPGDRAFHSAVYDKTAQRMIVYGGENILLGTPLYADIWALSLPDPALGSPAGDLIWSQMASTNPPPARTGHTAVFDSAFNRMIVFGGVSTSTLAELWILDLNASPAAWIQITAGAGANNFTGQPPSARRNHTAVYDPVRREMTIFGGSSGGTVLIDDDIYVLKLPATGPYTWSIPLGPGLPPVWRDMHAAVYNSAGAEMLIFAGRDGDTSNGNSSSGGDGSILNNELWSLSAVQNYAWNLRSIGGTPSLRAGHSAVFDPINRRMVVLGGGDDSFNPLPTPNLYALNLGSSGSWTLLSPFNSGPAELENHSAVFDEKYGRLIVFGGRPTKNTYTAQTWWIGQ
jgi:hypothetical protein